MIITSAPIRSYEELSSLASVFAFHLLRYDQLGEYTKSFVSKATRPTQMFSSQLANVVLPQRCS